MFVFKAFTQICLLHLHPRIDLSPVVLAVLQHTFVAVMLELMNTTGLQATAMVELDWNTRPDVELTLCGTSQLPADR